MEDSEYTHFFMVMSMLMYHIIYTYEYAYESNMLMNQNIAL